MIQYLAGYGGIKDFLRLCDRRIGLGIHSKWRTLCFYVPFLYHDNNDVKKIVRKVPGHGLSAISFLLIAHSLQLESNISI